MNSRMMPLAASWRTKPLAGADALDVVRFWEMGLDTSQIAKLVAFTESQVYNLLADVRRRKFDRVA